LGGPVPVKNDTKAELVVQRSSISDKAFLETMERKGRHKVLDEGTPLLVCLTIKPKNPPSDTLKPLLQYYGSFRDAIATTYLDYWNPDTSAFVEVKLDGPNTKQARRFDTDRGGLWLLTEGVEPVGLASTTVLLPPALTAKTVTSLNHAYTKLSETFETWRISHTGNIYTRILYQERHGTWYPLDILRNKALEKQEQEIARNLWEDFMAKMSMQEAPKRRNKA
jgi:hypothetical protein